MFFCHAAIRPLRTKNPILKSHGKYAILKENFSRIRFEF